MDGERMRQVLGHYPTGVTVVTAATAQGNVGFTPASSGSPIIDGAVAWVDCDIEDVLPAGDHWMVLGAVRALEIANPGDPLVFHRGRLVCLDAGVA